MNTFIVLLRGINVGGHKKVPMAELRDLLSKSGFENVKTYIQSGNIILQTSETEADNVENKVRKAIQSHFGFEVSVIAKTRPQLIQIFEDCPFINEKKTNSYFAILSEIPNSELVKTASEKIYEHEEYHIIKDGIYFYCAEGYGKAKFNLNYFERQLNTNATARNYRTMVKLLSLSDI